MLFHTKKITYSSKCIAQKFKQKCNASLEKDGDYVPDENEEVEYEKETHNVTSNKKVQQGRDEVQHSENNNDNDLQGREGYNNLDQTRDINLEDQEDFNNADMIRSYDDEIPINEGEDNNGLEDEEERDKKLEERKKYIMESLNKKYRNYRARLKSTYYDTVDTNEDRFKEENMPPNVDENDWKWLVEYFGSTDFKV
ncbi:component of gems protein 1-like [Chenopodium quinoa]|uniref:component of gems protein 1-like n=1 Tax=Chenopodium quinoa TaxID=63459 RepID=UPI000B77B0B8|nr:component of gems protein 1-like [Chenopodium quinoa]